MSQHIKDKRDGASRQGRSIIMHKREGLVSILTTILWIVHVVAWVTVIGAGIGTLILFFAVPLEGLINSFDNASADLDNEMGDFVDVARAFVGGLMFLLVSRRLIDVLRSLKRGTPFESENAERFIFIGKIVVYAELAKIALAVFGGFIVAITPLSWGNEDGMEISLTNWLGAGIALVLAEVFREGARLREDQELTV